MDQLYAYVYHQIKYGKLGEFNETMEKVTPVLEERGWKLAGAWSPVTGDRHEIHDLWELPDANTVPDTVNWAMTEPRLIEADPAFSRSIRREITTLFHKTPYSP